MDVVALFGAEFQDVAETPRRDQRGARTRAFNDKVGDKGRAMQHVIQFCVGDARLRQQRVEAGQGAFCRIGWCGQAFMDVDRGVCRIEQNEVGERATDVEGTTKTCGHYWVPLFPEPPWIEAAWDRLGKSACTPACSAARTCARLHGASQQPSATRGRLTDGGAIDKVGRRAVRCLRTGRSRYCTHQHRTCRTVLRVAESTLGEADPQKPTDFPGAILMVNLYDYLVFPKPGGGLEPSLAKSWTISPDGLTYTFVLRDDVSFHDGTKFSAKDVVFTVKRMQTLKRGVAFLFASVKNVEAVDPTTVKFELSQPFSPFVAALARLAILNSDLVTKNFKPEGNFGENGDYGQAFLSSAGRR